MFRLSRFVLPLVLLLLAAAPAPAQEPPPELTAEEARALSLLLQEESRRQALIDKLNALAEAEATEAQQPAAEEDESLPRQIADFTRESAESVATLLSRVLRDLQGLARIGEGRGADYAALGHALLTLAALIVITVGVFVLLNRLAQRLYGRLGRTAAASNTLVAFALLIASVLIDALLVAIAWGVGYAVAVFVLGTAGRVELLHSLFLNAFLVIELVKVGLRGIFAPRYGELRILPLSDMVAAYWYLWLGRLVTLLGYGSLVVVPIVNAHMSLPVGRSLQVLIALAGVVMAIIVILQSRGDVRDRLQRRADARGSMMSRTLAAVGRVWHVFAILYVVTFFVVWVAHPGEALAYMLAATGKSLVAVLVGFLVVGGVSRAIEGGLRVPQEMRERLPLLETHLNAFIPNILRVVRVVAFILVVAAVLDAWQVADIGGWLTSPTGQAFIAAVLSAAAVVVVSWLVWLAMSSWVEYRLNPNLGRVVGARERTLLKLLRNAVTILLATLAIMLALSQLGIDIGPLLAGAGVVGLAIGFGAQKLVQDVITGVFIQFENAINEGDVVSAGGISGAVERLTIRSVGIRDLSGVYHIVPFSSVDTVSNFMRGFAFHLVEMPVAYREDVAEVKQAMLDAFEELRQTEHQAVIIGDFEMHGVTEFRDSSMIVRGRIKTLPGSQWGAGRAYNEIIKRVFDERGINIPFPHRTIYFGEDKQGKAVPLRVETKPEGGKEEGKEGES
ncbi:MAG: mechanosensitive ion channel domain-containing protein [Bacteroidota bacterium]